MTSQILKDQDIEPAAPGDLGASNRGVGTEGGCAGRGTGSCWLGGEIEPLICSAGGCIMVLMFFCVRGHEE